ncbi:MAG: aminoacyl-tRNA hydrolase [Sciscionella sp.]
MIVGLGNPGPGYAGNRHNIGFRVLDELAARIGGRFKAHKSGNQLLTGRLAERQVALIKPSSFMNLSGGPVSSAMKYFKLTAADIVVVHDDIDLPFDTVRLKSGGGAGGHNGLRSISNSLDTGDFARIRVGVGRPPGRMDPADFVLRDFSAVERKELPFVLDRAADAVQALLERGMTAAQNTFHS